MTTNLFAAWMDAKRDENEAKARRLAVEQELIAQFPGLPEVGEKSFKVDCYKSTFKNGLNFSLKSRDDWEKAIADGIVPAGIIKPELYDTGFKRLRAAAMLQDERALKDYGKVLPLVNIKPAKTEVTVVVFE